MSKKTKRLKSMVSKRKHLSELLQLKSNIESFLEFLEKEPKPSKPKSKIAKFIVDQSRKQSPERKLRNRLISIKFIIEDFLELTEKPKTK